MDEQLKKLELARDFLTAYIEMLNESASSEPENSFVNTRFEAIKDIFNEIESRFNGNLSLGFGTGESNVATKFSYNIQMQLSITTSKTNID